jgi:hypothetical protein
MNKLSKKTISSGDKGTLAPGCHSPDEREIFANPAAKRPKTDPDYRIAGAFSRRRGSLSSKSSSAQGSLATSQQPGTQTRGRLPRK